MDVVGKVVRKEFDGLGFCLGTVRSRDSSGFFEIVYENGLTETMKLAEVVALLGGGGDSRKETVRVKPRVGRRPKKRPRIERMQKIMCGRAGDEEGLQNGIKSVKHVDLNYAFTENSEVRGGDVNFSGNVDFNCGSDKTLARKCVSETDLNGRAGDSKIEIDLNTGLDLNSNEGLGLINVNIDFEENFSDKRRGYIDLNKDANCDLDEVGYSVLNAEKRVLGFDLNVEIDMENSKDDMDGDQLNRKEGMKQDDSVLHENGEFKEVRVTEVTSEQLLVEIQKPNSVSGEELYTRASNGVNDGSQFDMGNSYEIKNGSRKRKTFLDNSNLTNETVLRRSARRMSYQTRVSSSATACLLDDISPSPAVSGLTEEKIVIMNGNESKETALLPPKPQLPLSSRSFCSEGLPMLDVFSIYSCLRSFSTLLFLSPFELEDFAEALKSVSPNLLFDSIHVSVLQLLRKHLDRIASEGDLSASDCLRSLDWDMLDMVTYPLYIVEYILFRGSDHNPRLDISRSEFFKFEYFKQPVTLKVEILRRFCEDMIDVKAVRTELNRRSMAPEFETEIERNMNTEVGRRKRTTMEMAEVFSSNDEVFDNSCDWNSDECCLCKMDGNLLCCDGCPAAYHAKCIGAVSHLLPEGDWYCPECAFDRLRPGGLKPGKLIRGAEFLETDPHGRQYYSSCGYLLVKDTDDSGSLSYFHLNDIHLVLDVLKSCGSFYSSVIDSINKHWDGDVGLGRTISTTGVGPSIDLSKADPPALEDLTASDVEEQADDIGNNHLRSPRKLSDSATGPDAVMSSGGSDETVQARLGDSDLKKNSKGRINTRKGIKPKVQSESRYRNCYSFAQTTSLIAEEMIRKSPAHTVVVKSDEDIVSTQVKTIMKKSSKFHWRFIQSLYLDAWKERCGWCYSCKNPSEDMGSGTDCLFNMSLGSIRGLPESEIANIQSNNKCSSHLVAVTCQIISMESRLQGLLIGPWLDPQYSRIWRGYVLKASNISTLNDLFLQLEANLHPRVLSSEWLNNVDSAATMGSAMHIVIASARSSSKSAIAKRRGKLLDSGVKHTMKKDGGLTMCWWRGGKLSRQLFCWKVLPRSLVLKAARQGGGIRVPGIFYPENSDSPKRSRRIAWKAAVELCKTSEQLGLQVRQLDSYIMWDDIENTHLLPALDKESRKYVRLFKKAIVRRKSLEGESVKYLLDFGKRRNIPEVVLKNGCMIEESSSERKKFWLDESYVPLHLLKGFEEKKIVRKNAKMGSFRVSEAGKALKRSSDKKGFEFLFARAERSESSCCGHCNKDVLLSEAVCCHICKGSFHKKHVGKASGEKEGYICHKCRGEILANEQPKVRKRGRPPGSFRRKGFGLQAQKQKAAKAPRLRKTKTLVAERISLRLQNHKKVVASLPLRRSTRRPKHVSRLQDEGKDQKGTEKQKLKVKSKRGRGRPRKIKQEISWRKPRTTRLFSYWLNGLLLSRKPDDERVAMFRRDRYFIPSDNSDSDLDQPKCRLCGLAETKSESAFIACEICGEWFHGDAYGLNDEIISMMIGFRCHGCRKQSLPECPHQQIMSPVAS